MAKTIIFFGSQGSGKGTQSRMCASFLESKGDKVISIATGEGFRKFGEEGGEVGRRVKESLDRGEMLPVFFPVWLWTKTLLETDYSGNEHIIIDGSPRTVEELDVFNAALDFYSWKPAVINLSLSEEEVFSRIRARGRSDDSNAGVEKRLAWYREHTLPVLERMREDDRYQVFDIDGARSVDEIFVDIKNIIES